MKKSVVSSFDVDHRTLREGLYLRSTYTINDDVKVLSWDLRFCAPMDRKPLSAGTVHTIEHLMAYYLRLDDIVGLNEIQCGNPYLYDVEGANEAMNNYIKILSQCEF